MPGPTPLPSPASAARRLADAGRRFYERGWVLGTSGNFSAVTSRRPLRIVITPSATHKGRLSGREFLTVGETGRSTRAAEGRPSAETLLHLEIVRARGAGAVLHTHSVWGTILSDLHAADEGLAIEGYEMLKGLAGVNTHVHREWLPILENDQDMPRLAAAAHDVLTREPAAHGLLLRGHGLYTWGATIDEAERHVEILEFLLEALGRRINHGHHHHP
ncbi:MAG: methylthioribulose 1-phosphate dehydratase [Acidobacteriota bacterium]